MNTDFFVPVKEILTARKYTIPRGGGCDRSQGRQMYGLILCCHGSANFHMTTGEVFTLQSGSLAWISDTAAYRLDAEEDFVHYTVNFTVYENEDPLWAKLGKTPMTLLCPQELSSYEPVFADLCRIWKEKRFGFPMDASARLYSLLRSFVEEAFVLPVDPHAYRTVLPAKEYLETHLREAVTLSELADLCGLSVTHFRRLFFKVFHMTPMEYRDRIRLLHAKDYRLGNVCSLREVAARCGFEDGNYFSRFFKKHTGVSPSAFRRGGGDIR